MGAAILENMPVTRSKDSTLFREISREIFAVRVDRTATSVGFREISREMLWPNARYKSVVKEVSGHRSDDQFTREQQQGSSTKTVAVEVHPKKLRDGPAGRQQKRS